MFYTVVLTMILIICWMASCVYCYNFGIKYKKKTERMKKAKPKAPNETERQKEIKFMRELENLFTYDGSVQE